MYIYIMYAYHHHGGMNGILPRALIIVYGDILKRCNFTDMKLRKVKLKFCRMKTNISQCVMLFIQVPV